MSDTKALLIFMSLSLCACKGSNVEPGDHNYPQLNSHPRRVIEMKVSVPPNLAIRFYASYSARWHQDDCQYAANALEGVYVPFSVTDPIAVAGKGDKPIGLVSVDKYAPGRCGWHFASIVYSIIDDQKLDPSYEFLKHGGVADSLEGVADLEAAGWKPMPGELYEGRADLWCRERVTVTSGGATPQCSSWEVATHIPGAPQTTDESRNAPGSDREDAAITYIMPSTKIIEVYFHDLDADHASIK
jgi:hypothetical protein